MRNDMLFEADIWDIHISVIADKGSYRLSDHTGKATSKEALMGFHRHSFYELFFAPEDSISIVTESGETTFENKAVIIPQDSAHYVSRWARTGYCLIFALERLQKKDSRMYENVIKLLDRGISSFEVDSEMNFYMERLSDIISGENDSDSAVHLTALLFMSFFRSLKEPDTRSTASSLKYRNYVNTLDQYISRHYAEQIRIDDIAAELHLCSKQVSRIINKEYGMSLSRFVHRHRMSIACMLLKNTSLSLSQISESVGYEYENYFFRTFKEMYGMTPTEYREQCWGEEDRTISAP